MSAAQAKRIYTQLPINLASTARVMRLAVAQVYSTPDSIDVARRSWLAGVPAIFAGDLEDSSRNLRFVPGQDAFARRYGPSNHKFDNRPLALIRLANRTLEFDWLLVGDMDTCFHVDALRAALSPINPARRHFLGMPAPPGQTSCSSGKSILAGKCCSIQDLVHFSDCVLTVRRARHFRNSSIKHPHVANGRGYVYAFPHGGAGYVLSSGLLRAISEAQWSTCESELLEGGGDLRVGACVYHTTGVGLTELPGLLGNLSRHKEVCPFSKSRVGPHFRTRATARWVL